ncbi:hypothetical protein E1178_03430 [Roseibium hamelinense]|nr:hypothetical protein [Roseibium hamelinense]
MRGVETPGVSGQAGPAGTPVAGAPFPRPKPDTRTGSIPAPRSVASTPVPPPPATRQIATAPAPANPPRGAGRSASSSGQAPVPPEVIPAPQADTRLVQIQRLLADLGYGPLAADGRMGDNTSKAIQRFQLDRGLPLTGLPTADVVERLEMVSGQNITN